MAFPRTFVAAIVGSKHYAGALSALASLSAGDPLTLVREPDNPYDPNAVAVNLGAMKLGHLPRGIAAQVAHFLDEGYLCSCCVSDLGAPNLTIVTEKADSDPEAGDDK